MAFLNSKFTDPRWGCCIVSSGKVFIRGNAFLDERSLAHTELANYLEGAIADGKIVAGLQRLNGFHSWVYDGTHGIHAAVDHVRSVPLFYAAKGDEIFLSDEAEWVRQQTGDNEMDVLAKEEFLLAGYVTGSSTLYKSVSQLQAGELLKIRFGSGKADIDCSRYFRFIHVEPASYDPVELEKQLGSTCRSSMQRLIRLASGRQIVVPLSGGHDSRLIVTMLKKLGYINVLCFTYGVKDNKEAKCSREIARQLGFEWRFIEYSRDSWKREWKSDEGREYKRLASNHVSLPHVQDWLALRCMTRKGVIANDAVVVPGHSGDFVAGSHIPEFVFSKPRHSEQDLLRALIRDHFSNASNASILHRERLAARLKDRISAEFNGTDVNVANLYELWDWQERQAKYIVNSVRVYDQFGLEWWLPQWDKEFVRFWEAVPLVLRRRRTWFKSWIDQQYASVIDPSEDKPKRSRPLTSFDLRGLLRNLANSTPPPVIETIKRWQRRRAYKNHFLAFDALVEPDDLERYLQEGSNIIGMYSDLHIKGKW